MATFHEFQTSRKAKATAALKDATKRYIGFKERLRNFKVLDPACGSGNFLYLALQALKDIELRVGLEAEELGLERGFPEVGPQAMHGIEISPYAAELAKVTVWIGDIQWMLKHGFAPSREPILKTLDQIQCRDALIVIDDGGLKNAGALISEAEWPKVDAIIGNPPFLGGSKMREQLGDEYTTTLRVAYDGRIPGGANLVCYWYMKAQDAIENGAAARAGLVATQAIRAGANREVLDRIVTWGEIYNAWSDEEWINEGAAIRVSIVCFAKSGASNQATSTADSSAKAPRNDKFLDGRLVTGIYADLTASDSGIDLITAQQLSENKTRAFKGAEKNGAFEIPGTTAREWLSMPNPHAKANADVLLPWRNGLDVTDRGSDHWVIDFGNDISEADAALCEVPYRRVLECVKPVRATNNDANRKRNWWRFGRPAPDMRIGIEGLNRFIVTPRVAKHRVFVWLSQRTSPDSRLFVIARDDDTTFGVLHSRIHEVWSLANASAHGDGEDGGRPTYNAKSCFETFPFPEGLTPNLNPAQYTNPHAAAIATAAARLNQLRENWLNPPEWVDVVPEVVADYPDRIIPKPEFAKAIKDRTLTNLYNARAKGEVQWLDDVHRALDAAVAAAYGWVDYSPEMADDEILRRLLALNLVRV